VRGTSHTSVAASPVHVNGSSTKSDYDCGSASDGDLLKHAPQPRARGPSTPGSQEPVCHEVCLESTGSPVRRTCRLYVEGKQAMATLFGFSGAHLCRPQQFAHQNLVASDRSTGQVQNRRGESSRLYGRKRYTTLATRPAIARPRELNSWTASGTIRTCAFQSELPSERIRLTLRQSTTD
jgi:hypothetical protein